MKYIKEFRKHFSTFPVFSIKDAKIFLSGKKISIEYLYLLINNLLKRGEMFRITRGIYTFKKDPSVITFAFSPSYHALQDALSIHNLWEQETNTIIVTPLHVRTGIRELFGATVIIRRIDRSMFFGFEMVKHLDSWLPVSDVEKTLIDFAYFKEFLDKKTLKEMKRRIDKKKLENYLKKVPKETRKRVEEILSDK